MKRLLFVLFVIFPALSLAENNFYVDIEDSLINSLKNSNRLLRLTKPEIILPTEDGDKAVSYTHLTLPTKA